MHLDIPALLRTCYGNGQEGPSFASLESATSARQSFAGTCPGAQALDAFLIMPLYTVVLDGSAQPVIDTLASLGGDPSTNKSLSGALTCSTDLINRPVHALGTE